MTYPDLKAHECRAFCSASVDGQGRTAVIASTAIMARDGLILDQETWRLEDYRANPVILPQHDAGSWPIGRAEDVRVEDGALRADIVWDEEDEDGARVKGKFDRGFLNAVSVRWSGGRLVDRADLPENHPLYGDRGAPVLQGMTLLEISPVTIPGDPRAVAVRSADAERDRLLSLLDDPAVRARLSEVVEGVRLASPPSPELAPPDIWAEFRQTPEPSLDDPAWADFNA